MPTIEQLRQDIASKQANLETCSRELKDLTKERANQQGKVTRKENKIKYMILTNQSTLTATESTNLTNLKRELISDKQELDFRERARASCSRKETNLILEVGRLKMELNKLESSGGIDYSKRSSFRR